MSKKLLIAALCLVSIVLIYFLAFRPTNPTNPTSPTSPTKPAISDPPTTSLEERVCGKVSTQFGDCKKILLFDANSNLVFAESSSGIIPVLTNKEFTDFKKFIYPEMNFQEFFSIFFIGSPFSMAVKMIFSKSFPVGNSSIKFVPIQSFVTPNIFFAPVFSEVIK